MFFSFTKTVAVSNASHSTSGMHVKLNDSINHHHPPPIIKPLNHGLVKQSVFYEKYSNCKEILKKVNGPYTICIIEINKLTFAIPIRHNINHKYLIKT